MNDQTGGAERQMDDDFRADMRRGLRHMIVTERRRAQRRNRVIAGSALALVLGAVVAVGAYGLSRTNPEQDRALPAPTASMQPSADATQPPHSTAAETSPTPPAGFEEVAAGVPHVREVRTCTDACGDQGATGSGPSDRLVDAYLLCEGRGIISRDGSAWIDCGEHASGSGFVELDVPATAAADSFSASADFDGVLEVVDAGTPPQGDAGAQYATVSVTCAGPRGAVTVGGVDFDCALAHAPEGEFVASATLAAWGVPIAIGELAPRIERSPLSMFVSVAFTVER